MSTVSSSIHITQLVSDNKLEQGDILGHDLMSPHIILSNIGSVSSLQNPQHTSNASHGSPSSTKYHSSSPEFLSYVESLLERPHQNSGVSLLSPTDPDPRSSAILTKGLSTMKDSVDLAVLRSNSTSLSGRNVNRFELTRSGDRVATILLARPAYRLGETIPVVIDLTNSDVQCFSLHAALETFESIDPAIALRSKASIQRVTRRVHASQFEITIAAKRVLFNPMIPFTSTPDFVTSGINLEWRLRFEFVTNRIADSEEIDEDLADLLEVVARDERGIVKAAAQGLTCETFDVAVPLRVYGATPGFDEKTEPGEFPI